MIPVVLNFEFFCVSWTIVLLTCTSQMQELEIGVIYICVFLGREARWPHGQCSVRVRVRVRVLAGAIVLCSWALYSHGTSLHPGV